MVWVEKNCVPETGRALFDMPNRLKTVFPWEPNPRAPQRRRARRPV